MHHFYIKIELLYYIMENPEIYMTEPLLANGDPNPLHPEELQRRSTICRTIAKKLDNTYHADGTYDKVKKIRPMYLYVLRMFDYMDRRYSYNSFLRSCYSKTTEFISILHTEMELLAQNDPDEAKKYRYMNIFLKNMVSFRIKCIQSTLAQYSKLPGHIPLVLRSHIVSYITYLPINL